MKLLDVLTSPWAIMPEKLLEIQAIYATHLRGEKIDITGIEAAAGKPLQNDRTPYQVDRGVAIIGIEGIIAKKMNMFTKISGGVSTQIVKADFRQAMADPAVKAILLVIDSPGGTVDGTEELAAEIASARGVKPVITYTDGVMASAAYWIGSAADAIYISGDTAWVGSIGVVTSHTDYSGWEEKMGLKTTEIYAGKYKRIDSEYQPLSQEGRDYIQSQVDYIYSTFARTVAAHRSDAGLAIPPDGEAIPWADGKIFIGSQALEQGLADGVSSIDRLIDDMAQGRIAGQFQLWARLEREKDAIIAQLRTQQGGTL
jgi:capsid assembly protease